MRMRVTALDLGLMSPRVNKAAQGAMRAVAENARSDCRPYIPYLTGDLRNSGRVRVQMGPVGPQGFIDWGTDRKTARYARYQWSRPLNHNTPGNAANAPKATDHWFDRAAQARSAAWMGMFAADLRRQLNG